MIAYVAGINGDGKVIHRIKKGSHQTDCGLRTDDGQPWWHWDDDYAPVTCAKCAAPSGDREEKE